MIDRGGAWSAYLAFDHAHPVIGNLDLRKALAHAIDRDALADVGESIVIATGGIVPPATGPASRPTLATSSPVDRTTLLNGSGLRLTAPRAPALAPWPVSARP